MRKLTVVLACMAFVWLSSLTVLAGSGGTLSCSHCAYAEKDVSVGRGFFNIYTLLFCPHCTHFSSVLTGVDESYFREKNTKELEKMRSEIVKPRGKADVSTLGPALKSYVLPTAKTVVTYSCPSCKKSACAVDDNVLLGSSRKPVVCPRCTTRSLKFTQIVLWD